MQPTVERTVGCVEVGLGEMTTVENSALSGAGRHGQSELGWPWPDPVPSDGEQRLMSLLELSCDWVWDMDESLRFASVRATGYGKALLQDEELLNMVRFFTWSFPSFAPPEQTEELKRLLDPQQIHETVRRAATELVTPFSSLGTNYFVADPLGMMEMEAHHSEGFSQFANFDLNWGSGNRFFSKDHKALLIIAEPRESAMDYKFAGYSFR